LAQQQFWWKLEKCEYIYEYEYIYEKALKSVGNEKN